MFRVLNIIVIFTLDNVNIHRQKKYFMFSAIIDLKEVYQSLTIDIIGKCAFGIEVNSLQPSKIDRSNKFYKTAIDTFSTFTMTNRWMAYFWTLFFNMFPGVLPAQFLFPANQMDCKSLPNRSIHIYIIG